MKVSAPILLMSLMTIVGCLGNSEQNTTNLEMEIDGLETDDAKKRYLERILEDDQKVRDGEVSAGIMLKYGQNSNEYLNYIRSQAKQDHINLEKIEHYLFRFGYPKRSEVGQAADVPWLVIHHSQGSEARKRNFVEVYKAYLRGDIDGGAMSFYLGRMYEIRYGERLKMESPYTGDDEINQLIRSLDLEELKANAPSAVAR